MLYVIEGLDGSGKSTQVALLRDRFKLAGYRCRFIHFPRPSMEPFGSAIAMFLRGEFGDSNRVSPYLVALLFACDQWQAKELLTTDRNEVIILDRYYYSNIAYQAAKIADTEQRLAFTRWLSSIIDAFGMVKPDRAIYLDVPLAFRKKNLAEQRLGCDRDYLKGSDDIHEVDLPFQERVGEEYRRLCYHYDELYQLDCTDRGVMLPVALVTENILNLINHQEA